MASLARASIGRGGRVIASLSGSAPTRAVSTKFSLSVTTSFLSVKPASTLGPALSASLAHAARPLAPGSASRVSVSCGFPIASFSASVVASPAVSSSARETGPAHSPREAYQRALAAGELKEDPRQHKTIEKLHALWQSLTTTAAPTAPVYTAPTPAPKPAAKEASSGGFFGRFFGGGSSSDSASSSTPAAPARPTTVPAAAASHAPKGLYIYGGVGCGKTMMMDMFFDTVPSSSVPKVRKHFHSFMLEVHQRLHKLRTSGDRSSDPLVTIAREFVQREGRLLCLDEFQVTDVADAMILKELFTHLFAHGCVVVATSNRPPKDLYLNGLNRDVFLPFIDILQARTEVLPMEDMSDYRLLVTMEEGVFHAPLDAATRASMDSIFAKLAAGGEVRPVDVSVMMGRSLHVPAAVPDRVARFTFEELCARALGAADYYALAKNFPCVLVTDIPLLYFDRREVIRRFITLLDVLYEHRTKVFLSAAAPPAELFRPARSSLAAADSPAELAVAGAASAASSPGIKKAFNEDEVFASARAISRLVEMSSTTYLSGSLKAAGSRDTPSQL